MKILRLRFSNLNSLLGEWSIDFTMPPLSDAGLFAITGSTGAGKTTLLDAMTLALFGRASRYGTEPSPEQMMSRQAGFCSAEVEFSCASGNYRSVWLLRRARNQPAGKVQNPERKVVSLPDEQVLTQKIDDSNRKIEELTSLNYERFLRSVMLAQGEFATFLKAKPNERTELLEQITGTGIYSDISKAAYRCSESARLALEALHLRRGNVQVLPTDERKEREKQLADTTSRLHEIRDQLGKLEIRICDTKAFLACAQETGEIEREVAQIAQERKSSITELGALELHEKAGPFIARLTERDLLAKQQEEDDAKLASLRSLLPALFLYCRKTKGDADAARMNLERAEREEATLKPLWAEVTMLDREISVARNRAVWRTETRRQAEDALQKLQKELDSKQRSLKEQRTSLSELSSWLAKHAGDARITDVLPDLQIACARWRDHRSQWAEIRNEVAALEQAIREIEQALAVTTSAAGKLKADWQATEANAEKVRGELEKLAEGRAIPEWEKDRDAAHLRVGHLIELQTMAGDFAADTARRLELQNESKKLAAKDEALRLEITTKKDQLQAVIDFAAAQRKNRELVQIVQSLEQERHALVDGQACPLCGSTEHPYASPENVPSAALKAATTELERAEQQVEKVRRATTDLEKQQAATTAEKKRTDVELTATAERIRHREKQRGAKTASLETWLAPTQTNELAALLALETQRSAILKQRLEDLRAVDRKLRETERTFEWAKVLLSEKTSEKERLDSTLRHTRDSLGKATGRGTTSEASVDEWKSEFVRGIAAFELDAADVDAAEETVKLLKHRSDGFATKAAARTSLEGDIKVAEYSIGEVLKQIEAGLARIATLKQAESTDQEALQALLQIRRDKFEEKEVAADQERVAAVIKSSRKASEDAASLFTDFRQKHETCENQIEELAKTASVRRNRISADTASFACDADRAGFATLDLLRKAVLPETRAQELGALRKRLDNAEQVLNGRRATNHAAQAKLPGAAKDDSLSLGTLTVQRNTFEVERQTLDQRFGALQEELRQDDERRKSQSEIAGQIERAEREFQRWARLSALIGSAAGNMFARFAQGLTLERLVAVANRHLVHLSPRYSMRRSDAGVDDLELEIIDRYQGDVTRPMRSLSGGESFLASLALAVGLSELASGRTAIESLFIDEGFGTLDPATLETAMAALEGLQTNGKTIGVISHVDVLKERIITQIHIRKHDGGRSTLEVVS